MTDPHNEDRATQRRLAAQIAANERWAREPDRSAALAPARAGMRAKFAHEIDPTGTMPAHELERRIEAKVKAHMQRMSLAAKKARARRRPNGAASA